jgi:hypothetical protein
VVVIIIAMIMVPLTTTLVPLAPAPRHTLLLPVKSKFNSVCRSRLFHNMTKQKQ